MAEPTASARPAASARLTILAAASVVVWALAAWSSREYGPWVSIGGAAVALALPAIALEGHRLAGRGRLGRGGAVGVGAGVAMAGATALLYEPVAGAWPALGADAARLYVAFSLPGLSTTLLLLPVVVIAEEVVWRGTVHAVLEHHLSPAAATAAGTLAYAAALAPTGSPTLVLTALCAGACWTALRTITGSLSAALTAHLVWDLLVLVVGVVPLAG